MLQVASSHSPLPFDGRSLCAHTECSSLHAQLPANFACAQEVAHDSVLCCCAAVLCRAVQSTQSAVFSEAAGGGGYFRFALAVGPADCVYQIDLG